MGLQWLENLGLLWNLVGTGVLVWASIKVNPVNAFREKEGTLEVSTELLRDLSRRFINYARWGFMTIGIGILIQITANNL